MIRFANEEDIVDIMNFINSYWKEGHILARDRLFFEYEHLLSEGVTYVISREDGNINAILGCIPYGLKDRDVMTVMWKANHSAEPSLGIKLFNFLKENGDVRILASPGSNPKLKGLYKYLGYTFGKMNHWYRLNNLIKDFKISKISDSTVPESISTCEYEILESWEDLENKFDYNSYVKSNPKPLKEKWYIKKRYFEHPINRHIVCGLKKNGVISLLLVIREINACDSTVLRLIDCIGDFELLKQATRCLDELLKKFNAEYIDMYETGVDEEIMKVGGWIRTVDSGNIIPNYFAPFVQENIDIYYFSSDSNIVLFKGDGDQDRPC